MGHPCNTPAYLMRETNTPLLVYKKSLLKYCIDLEMWLLLCDECSHDGCFHFRMFLIRCYLLPRWARSHQSHQCHHCRVLHHWGNLKCFTQPSRCTSFWSSRKSFSTQKSSVNTTGNVYSSSHHVKRPQSSSFLPRWPGASRARGTSCTGSPETCAGSSPPARREVHMWPLFHFGEF